MEDSRGLGVKERAGGVFGSFDRASGRRVLRAGQLGDGVDGST